MQFYILKCPNPIFRSITRGGKAGGGVFVGCIIYVFTDIYVFRRPSQY
jgi:hypothetical protein